MWGTLVHVNVHVCNSLEVGVPKLTIPGLSGFLEAYINIVLNYGKMLLCPPPGKVGISFVYTLHVYLPDF